MNEQPITTVRPASDTTAPDPVRLAELLARAESALAKQGRAYRTELDEDGMWRASWNTWRTLTELVPAVRALLAEQQPTATEPDAEPVRLAAVLPLHRANAVAVSAA